MRRAVRFMAMMIMLVPLAAEAQVVPAMPIGPETAAPERIAAARSHASVELLRGRGDRLILEYASDAPIDAFLFPVLPDGSPVAAGALVFSLPPGEGREASVDVSVSSGWAPGEASYRLHLLSGSGDAPRVTRAEIVRSDASLAAIAFRQAFQSEPYQPSTYHRLRGYRMLGVPFAAIVAGMIIVAAAAACFLIPRRGAETCLRVILVGVLLCGARFSVDLLRFTGAHARAWTGGETYLQAGSLYRVADVLGREGASDILLCHDGTSYLPSLLQYLVYPARVHVTPSKQPSHAVVIQKVRWSYDDGILHCGDWRRPARTIASFADGAAVFQLFP